jgi:hypothetical protein
LVPLEALAAGPSDAFVRPSADFGRRVDVPGLVERLARAPMESSDPQAGIEIALPLPDGRTERFRAMVSPILGPGLTRLLPDVRTYRAVGLDDPQAVARMDVTARGFRAIIATREGTALIEPVEPGRTDAGMSHWDRSLAGLRLSAFLCKRPHHRFGTRPSNTIVKWFSAATQSLIGRAQRSDAFWIARYRT